VHRLAEQVEAVGGDVPTPNADAEGSALFG
jgi:hypothetical protein